VRLYPTRLEPARQPEAVAAGFKGNRNPRDIFTGPDRLIAPAMQQAKQPFGIRLQLLARLTLNAGEHTGNQPARLAQLDDGNDRAILVQGDEGPAQSLLPRWPGSFGWGIAALHRLHAATKLPFPRRPPHSFSRSRIATRRYQACRHPRLDHIASDQNDRNCAVRRVDRLREGVGGGNNHVRVPVDDLASEITVALGSLLAGIPPDVRFCASASPSRRSSFQNGWQRRLTGTVTGATRGDLERAPTLRGTAVSNPVPFSSESANFRSLSPSDLMRSGSAGVKGGVTPPSMRAPSNQLYAEQRRRGTHGDGLKRGGKGRFQGADR
jgi:hypothetical protein